MKIRHFVLLKFREGYFDESVFELAKEAFARVEGEVPEVAWVRVYKNCVLRDTNCDIMVVLELACEQALQKYLGSPAHMAFAEATLPHLEGRSSFDHVVDPDTDF